MASKPNAVQNPNTIGSAPNVYETSPTTIETIITQNIVIGNQLKNLLKKLFTLIFLNKFS